MNKGRESDNRWQRDEHRLMTLDLALVSSAWAGEGSWLIPIKGFNEIIIIHTPEHQRINTRGTLSHSRGGTPLASQFSSAGRARRRKCS